MTDRHPHFKPSIHRPDAGDRFNATAVSGSCDGSVANRLNIRSPNPDFDGVTKVNSILVHSFPVKSPHLLAGIIVGVWYSC